MYIFLIYCNKGYKAWLKEEIRQDNSELTKVKKTFAKLLRQYVVNYKLSRVQEVEGQKKPGYLGKLSLGDTCNMGNTGTFFSNGIHFNLWRTLFCCLGCCQCRCLCFIWTIPRGLIEDCMYYVFNNHGMISCICCETDHPYSRVERMFAQFALGCLTFFGTSVVNSYNFSDVENNLWNVLFIGFLNFLLTNVFQILFACSCVFHQSKKSETEVHHYCRKVVEGFGSITGMLLSTFMGLFFLLISAEVCRSGSGGLQSFAVKSQVVGSLLDLVVILIKFVPVVVSLRGLPILGDRVLCGSWYHERYIRELSNKESAAAHDASLENGAGAGAVSVIRDEEISLSPTSTPAPVPVSTSTSSPTPSKKEETSGSCCSNEYTYEQPPIDGFLFFEISFKTICCCQCICCFTILCNVEKSDIYATVVHQEEKKQMENKLNSVL